MNLFGIDSADIITIDVGVSDYWGWWLLVAVVLVYAFFAIPVFSDLGGEAVGGFFGSLFMVLFWLVMFNIVAFHGVAEDTAREAISERFGCTTLVDGEGPIDYICIDEMRTILLSEVAPGQYVSVNR